MLTPKQLTEDHTTAEMVAAVVRADPSRFELTECNGSVLVRATHGHSLPVPQLNAQVPPIMPPAGPPSAWATLPIDVIGLIMAYHTQYARIHALSCVCKRWRTAALRSVTKLRAVSCDSAIALFPSLQSLALWKPLALPLPAGLTRLTMRCQASVSAAVSVPPLRSLKLSLNCNFVALEPTFKSVQSSLTALDLDGVLDTGTQASATTVYAGYFSAHLLVNRSHIARISHSKHAHAQIPKLPRSARMLTQ